MKHKNFTLGGFCPGGFVLGVFVRGVLSGVYVRGVFVRGVLSKNRQKKTRKIDSFVCLFGAKVIHPSFWRRLVSTGFIVKGKTAHFDMRSV